MSGPNGLCDVPSLSPTMETVEQIPGGYKVLDAVGQALAYVYGRENKADADIANVPYEALGYYHERKDERRDVGLGPEHDWSSRCADAFGLMAIAYEDPSRLAAFSRELKFADPQAFV